MKRLRLRRRAKAAVALFLAVVAAVGGVAFFQSRLRPYVKDIVSIKSQQLAVRTVNDAVVEIFAQDAPDYDDIIKLEKDSAGRITAVRADINKLNELKSEIITNVTARIENSQTSEVKVPVGSVIGGELFAGRGVKIKIRLKAVSYINVGFESVFESAGINQTMHRIMMNVEFEVVTLVTTYSVKTVTSCPFNVAETVIIGDVPDNFTDIGLMREEEYDNINDFME